jgi:hypothetical protein
VAPDGRKVGSLKRRVRSQLVRWKMKNYTPLWREPHFELKIYKMHQLRTTFGNWDIEKTHTVVARNIFISPKKNASGSDHFWKLKCRKNARRCDAKHISKSIFLKKIGSFLENKIMKKCTSLWHEAHFKIKINKRSQFRTTFRRWNVEKMRAIVVQNRCRNQNI